MFSVNFVRKEKSKQGPGIFLGKLEEFGDLRECAEMMGLDFESDDLDQGPRELKDLLEAWG